MHVFFNDVTKLLYIFLFKFYLSESEHFRHESLWLEVKLKDVALVTQDTLDVEGTPQCPEGSIRGVYEVQYPTFNICNIFD